MPGGSLLKKQNRPSWDAILFPKQAPTQIKSTLWNAETGCVILKVAYFELRAKDSNR